MDVARKRAGKKAAQPLAEDLFQLLVDSVRDYGIVLLDHAGIITTWGRGAENLFGLSAQAAIGQSFAVVYPDAGVRERLFDQHLRSARRDGRCEDEGWRLRQGDAAFWADVVITRIGGGDSPRGFATITRDLSERRALQQAEERFRILIESGKDHAIFSIDPDGLIQTWNVGARLLTGYLPDEVLGRKFSMLFDGSELPDAGTMTLLDRVRREGRIEHECWSLRKDDRRFWSGLVITALHDPDGRLESFAVVTRDLTVRKRVDELTEQQEALRDQALRDPLTDAFNRRHLLARLGEALEPRSGRFSAASLLFVDIDHFKDVNDRHGHPAGDKVLKAIARLARKLSRHTDLVFRLGGDEFALLLPGATAARATSVAERLRMAVEAWAEANDPRVTVSVGVAQSMRGDSIESWIARADGALYEAKRAGRNHVACHQVAH